MKKTFCDRCGVECNGQTIQRFTIFDVNRAIDVCENCYKEFFQWLNSEKDKPTPLGVHYSGEIISLDKDGNPIVTSKCTDGSDSIDKFIKESLSKPKPMDNDKLAALAINTLKNCKNDSDDGVDEFIKDVVNDKNDKNCLDDFIKDLDCEGCIHCPLGWHQEPCERCIRKRYAFREKIEINDSDHYIRKEKTDEN